MRAAFDALLGLDDAMADVVARATQPALAAIKLAWWRERIEELDAGKVPAEPRLKAAAAELLPRGISGAELARLEEGWAAALDESPDGALITERGARLFAVGAKLLGVSFDDTVAGAGRLFAAADARRRGILVNVPDLPRTRIPAPARPLTALAALAARDLQRDRSPEPEATPGRAWALLRHRLTGKL